MELSDTIAAISTPRGTGGVALLRVSGERAVEIASRVFCPKNGKALDAMPPRTVAYGTIYAPDGELWRAVDDGMAVVFRAPASFTGEDTVEICCHGGALLTQTVLTALLSAGARAAEAGEFTRRAFLNGKLDLSAAEAVGSMLEAKSHDQLALAYGGMSGRLSGRCREVYGRLRGVLTSTLACIDFPDEDLAEMSEEQMLAELDGALEAIAHLRATYRTGHAVAEGIATVICGRTNAGKSSLYNRLVGRDAAIVTDIEGTTRDVLCEVTTLGQVTLRLYDTAGLRETDDAVERIGIERARAAMDGAELILALFDLSRPLADDERAFLNELAERQRSGACVIALFNKADAADADHAKAAEESVRRVLPFALTVSVKTGQGMEALERAVNDRFVDGTLNLRDDAIVANARQAAALERSHELLLRAREALRAALPLDMVCDDLAEAMSALGELDGRQISEEVVSEIFSRFCVGK